MAFFKQVDIGFDGYQEKKCTECGWKYSHPNSDSYSHYNFDCPRCKAKGTLKDVIL